METLTLSEQEKQELFDSCESAAALEAKVGELTLKGLPFKDGVALVEIAKDYFRQVELGLVVKKAENGQFYINVNPITVDKRGVKKVSSSYMTSIFKAKEDDLIPAMRAIVEKRDKIIDHALKQVVALKKGEAVNPIIL